MNKKQSIVTVMAAGAALLAASQAQAQITYANEDLLLNFRNASSDSGSDVTVDVGNVTSFVNAVAALPGDTAVLDSGSGFATSSYTPQFTAASLISTGTGNAGLGTPATLNQIGFSAAAADTSSLTLWLTRKITASQLATGGGQNTQQGITAQTTTANAISGIGLGAESSSVNPLTGAGAALNGSVNGAIVADGNANSYHSLGQESPTSVDTIDYGGSQPASTPGVIEVDQKGATTPLYEALWETPVQGNGSDTYEGYFTFQKDGEVDFTAAAVPEPSTYGLLAGAGLLLLAFRRQLRSLVA